MGDVYPKFSKLKKKKKSNIQNPLLTIVLINAVLSLKPSTHPKAIYMGMFCYILHGTKIY